MILDAGHQLFVVLLLTELRILSQILYAIPQNSQMTSEQGDENYGKGIRKQFLRGSYTDHKVFQKRGNPELPIATPPVHKWIVQLPRCRPRKNRCYKV